MKTHTRNSLFVWTISFLVFSFGFLPYRLSFNRNYKSQPNVLLVDHSECTCCADFGLLQGEISIPDSLKEILKNKREIEIVGENTPLNQFKNEAATFDLIVGNSIILKGEVVGVDSLYGCDARPIFAVKKWGLKTYYPRFLTFGVTTMLIYLFICAIAIIFSLVRIIRQFTKPR